MAIHNVEGVFQKNMALWETQGHPMVVGVSGGADSVCLLYLCCKFGFQVTAVHVHHGIREIEGERDASFVQDLCARWRVPFLLYRYDVPAVAREKKMSVEEAGRFCRYEAFYQALASVQGCFIGVAHNQNDQAETVLMRLVRGSGLKGLGGMRLKRDEIIRPLLQVCRKDIEDYLAAQGVSYIQDSTNTDIQYTRNLIRTQVFPLLERINANTVQTLADTAHVLSADEAFLQALAKEHLKKYAKEEQGVLLPVEPFSMLPYPIQSRMIMMALEKVSSAKDVSRGHIGDILSLCTAQSGKQLMLPGNCKVYRSFDWLCFLKEETSTASFCYCYQKEKKLEIDHQGQWKACIYDGYPNERISPHSCTQSFDCDKIKNKLTIRSRNPGDFVQIPNVGRKKLKSFLTEKKIPVFQRDSLILLADGQEILWIVGYFTAGAYLATEETENVVTVSICRGITNDGKN